MPIVEIPYAKYLDCGYDQFTEAAIMHWLTNGKFTNGMIIRLQGSFLLINFYLYFFTQKERNI